MWLNPQETAHLVTLTKINLNEKLYFFAVFLLWWNLSRFSKCDQKEIFLAGAAYICSKPVQTLSRYVAFSKNSASVRDVSRLSQRIINKMTSIPLNGSYLLLVQPPVMCLRRKNICKVAGCFHNFLFIFQLKGCAIFSFLKLFSFVIIVSSDGE